MAKTVFAPGETDHSLRLEPCQCSFADVAVHHAAGVGKISKQEGNIENAEFGRDGRKDRGGRKSHLKRAGGKILAHLKLAARLARRVKLDPQTPATIALDIGGELQGTRAKLRISGIDDAHPQYLRLDSRIGAPAQKARSHGGRRGTRKEMPSSHPVTHVFPHEQSKNCRDAPKNSRPH